VTCYERNRTKLGAMHLRSRTQKQRLHLAKPPKVMQLARAASPSRLPWPLELLLP
jgi:hypothetical protein